MEFDWVTMGVLAGSLYGPVAAWQAAERPAQPWDHTSIAMRLFVVAALIGTVAAVVVLVAIDRPLLAALLAASSLISYLLARHRRSRHENQPGAMN
jgi:hypothetical protein